MDIQELQEYLATELDYPTALETVRTEVGDTKLESANADDEITIAEVLSHLDKEEYGSANELFESIQANLPEEYVGRKRYTDRGTTDTEAGAGRKDKENQSF